MCINDICTLINVSRLYYIKIIRSDRVIIIGTIFQCNSTLTLDLNRGDLTD